MCDERLRAPDVCDSFASRVDQPFGGVVSDSEFVGLDAGESFASVGGIDENQRIIGEAVRHVGDAVGHFRIQESVDAVTHERSKLLLFVRHAVGADGEKYISVCAGGILCAEDDAACVWGGGDFFADEAEHMRAAGA